MICKEPESRCFGFMDYINLKGRVCVQLLSSVAPAQKQLWTIVNEWEWLSADKTLLTKPGMGHSLQTRALEWA